MIDYLQTALPFLTFCAFPSVTAILYITWYGQMREKLRLKEEVEQAFLGEMVSLDEFIAELRDSKITDVSHMTSEEEERIEREIRRIK